MEQSFPVTVADPSVRALVHSAFPEYKGRKIKVEAQSYPLNVRSYWSGGSISYFCMVRMADCKVMPIPQNGTPFDGGPIAPNGVWVPRGFAIVEHVLFCGKDLGIRIHVHPDSLPKMLS